MRIAFRMKVNDGKESEYIARHSPIWSELEDVLKSHGVETYSIFLDRATNDLFAYAEIDDLEHWKAIATTEVCQKWWHSMAALDAYQCRQEPRGSRHGRSLSHRRLVASVAQRIRVGLY